jgi:uncharacterized membrane-anchored protein YhcB (DUF1043 family)
MFQLMIWLGSGFAFSVGCILGIVFSGAALGRSKTQQDEQVGLANKYLAERNEIGREFNQRLSEIRDAIVNRRN